jgi:hypothetical protein
MPVDFIHQGKCTVEANIRDSRIFPGHRFQAYKISRGPKGFGELSHLPG